MQDEITFAMSNRFLHVRIWKVWIGKRYAHKREEKRERRKEREEKKEPEERTK
jgi:hypothetical protein